MIKACSFDGVHERLNLVAKYGAPIVEEQL